MGKNRGVSGKSTCRKQEQEVTSFQRCYCGRNWLEEVGAELCVGHWDRKLTG